MDPSSASGADSSNKSELKIQELVVGARGFEPRTSCAQGRRATRLRYAPTELSLHCSVIYEFRFTAPPVDSATTVPISPRLKRFGTALSE
jgi:hypothetical protein